jgi:hypothetical protein
MNGEMGFGKTRHWKCRVLFARNPAKSAKIGHSLLPGIS